MLASLESPAQKELAKDEKDDNPIDEGQSQIILDL